MKKALFIFLILLNTVRPVSAQKNEELLKPERVYLHTDRDFYIAGDYLFYALYLHGSSEELSKYAYLIIRDKNNSFASNIRLEINDQTAFGSIHLSDTLSTGIYQVVCYTNFMRNEGEQAYFKKEIVIANRFDEKMDLFPGSVNASSSGTSYGQDSVIAGTNGRLTINLNKYIFDQREKISFSIGSNTLTGDSIARISVSISGILPGIPLVPSVTDYFGNRNFNSVDSNQNLCRFIPEFSGPVMQGKIMPLSESDRRVDSVKNYTLLISAVDSIVNMQVTTTDSLGIFGFHLNPYYDGKELIIRVKENVNSTILPDDKFSLIESYYPSQLFNVPGVKDYMMRSGRIAQVQQFYSRKAAIITDKEFLPSKTIPRVYYKQYSVIYPSDYIELPDFIEISKEIIPGLKVRKVDGRFISGYLNLQYLQHVNDEPAIFLDGVPIDDVNQIINLGTSRIKRIESIPVMRYYEGISFPGILAVFSKDLEINNIQFKTPSIRYETVAVQPYNKPEPFKPIDTNKHIPDLRQLLLWQPEIIIKKNEKQQIECYASDIPGRFRINIQGITSKGDPVNGSAIITIKSKLK